MADVGSGASTARPSSARRPDYVKSTLQRLQHDSQRSTPTPTGFSRSEVSQSPQPGWSRSDASPSPAQALPRLTQQQSPSQEGQNYATPAVRTMLMKDIARQYGFCSDDMKEQLLKLEEILRNADVLNFSEELAAFRAKESGMQQENEFLRNQCDTLLRLNADLRQKEIDSNLLGFSRKIDWLAKEFEKVRLLVDGQQNLTELVGACIQDTSQIRQAVAPMLNLPGVFSSTVTQMQGSLLREIRDTVEMELKPYKEQLSRIHQNTTQTITMELQVRATLDSLQRDLDASQERIERAFDLVHQNRNEILENRRLAQENLDLVEANRQTIMNNRDAIQANNELAASNHNLIHQNSQTISQNRKTISQNLHRIVKNESDSHNSGIEMLDKIQSLEKAMIENPGTSDEDKARLLSELHKIQTDKAWHEAEFARIHHQLQALPEVFAEMLRNAHPNGSADSAKQQSEKADTGLVLNSLENVAEIHRRGNIKLDLNSGEITVLHKINFVTRNPGDEPTAQFSDEGKAGSVIEDIAAIWKLFPVQLEVQGHTKDIGSGTEQFWQTLADNRAELCRSRLAALGVDPAKITAVGKPGKKGLNKAALVIKLDIFPHF